MINTVLFDKWRKMLINFSKQIGNNFLEIINAKMSSKPCKTSEMEISPRTSYWLQRQTQNLAKHLRWSFFQK